VTATADPAAVELAALDHLDPADVFAIGDAARALARGRVHGAALAERLADLEIDPDVLAAALAEHDQQAAAEYEAAGMTRLIRQRGLVP